jgi:hypothetical protein
MDVGFIDHHQNQLLYDFPLASRTHSGFRVLMSLRLQARKGRLSFGKPCISSKTIPSNVLLQPLM